MRINQTKRIYMNEADSSPGNGAPAAPPDPATPPASPAAAPIDVDALVTRLVGAVDERFTTLSNGLFANARKAGLLGKEKPADPAPAPQPPQAPAPPTHVAATGISMADVESMLEQERVFTRAATEHKLTDAQVKRMKNALKADKPEDISAWTTTFLADMGLVKSSPPPAAPAALPATTPAPAKPNISDRGTAAPSDLRDSEGVLNSRPLEMNGHDVESLLLKHGEHKGYQMFQEHVLRALGKVRIKPPRG